MEQHTCSRALCDEATYTEQEKAAYTRTGDFLKKDGVIEGVEGVAEIQTDKVSGDAIV